MDNIRKYLNTGGNSYENFNIKWKSKNEWKY